MTTASPPESAGGVSLGYGIAIAAGALVLISTIMLVSYVCMRIQSGSGSPRGREGGGERGEEHNGYTTRRPSNLSQEPIILVLGLERKTTLDTYPTFELGQSRRLPKPNNGPCSICLCEYFAKEKLRCIPECNHCFHASCIDEWLKVNASCPLCRNSPATTPLTTPLSELVPFAYHPR